MGAEVIRDSLLAVSGELDTTMSGRSVPYPSFSDLNFDARSRDSKLYESNRRSVYLPVLRSALYEVFGAFDFANPSTLNGKRSSTTVAPQALFMMNSELAEQASRKFADRLKRAALADEDRIMLAHELAYSRPAIPDEIDAWLAFLERYEQEFPPNAEADTKKDASDPWQALCRVMLSSNEFIYVE